MRTVRKLATALGALVAGLALVLLGAPGATAGGPTSVLLASPTNARAAALYGQEETYRELEQLLLVGRDIAGDKAPPMETLMDGQMVNVTWMIHDTQPWRVDRVYAMLPGTSDYKVWIHTVVDHEGMAPDLSKGVWHLAKQPGELNALLDRLGLFDASSAAGEATEPLTPAPGETEPAGAGPAATPDARPTTTASPTATTGWWWALPGIAAGAALVLGIRPMARRLPALPARLREAKEARALAREEGPRGELIDR
ncbi:hypothetical protein [Streptomyces indicus]|uniref:Uncharacterized protein n=1 Tax=Streptomyces indicus TaxID=417292 RepID=A0A1G9EHK5_9ACTN|nr:hypothetical protein [Streptomyces indicus]SDK75515.1 hypothetical protein SAMN05421806_111171 [Streptomyces indicus]